MKVYTRKGDDGSTGLYFGGRVSKDSARPAAYGDVDETQSAIGYARAQARSLEIASAPELDSILVAIQRDLWIVMADLATGEENRHKLVDGQTRVTAPMILALETLIDSTEARFDAPTEFVVPGGDLVSAALDVARTVCRRAERSTVSIGDADSLATGYLNRLSDLLWMLARWQEGSALSVRSLGATPPLSSFEGEK